MYIFQIYLKNTSTNIKKFILKHSSRTQNELANKKYIYQKKSSIKLLSIY
ncbi:hypothetical protein pb186bvf_010329 [Paramecium bursaria]